MAEMIINGTTFHMSDRAHADMIEGARLAEEQRLLLLRAGCMCPDDCNCRHPWRTNYCGCKAHAA